MDQNDKYRFHHPPLLPHLDSAFHIIHFPLQKWEEKLSMDPRDPFGLPHRFCDSDNTQSTSLWLKANLKQCKTSNLKEKNLVFEGYMTCTDSNSKPTMSETNRTYLVSTETGQLCLSCPSWATFHTDFLTWCGMSSREILIHLHTCLCPYWMGPS